MPVSRAKANGTKLGWRRVEPEVEAQILKLKAGGDGIPQDRTETWRRHERRSAGL